MMDLKQQSGSTFTLWAITHCAFTEGVFALVQPIANTVANTIANTIRKAFALLTFSLFVGLQGLMGLQSAQAQNAWPTRKPITLIAVFPAGGSVDQVARIISQPLGQELGQTVIVDNRGGASGTIGTALVAQAPADGYTFAVVFDTHGVNSSIYPTLSYDAQKDLTPLILVGTSPMVLATNVASEYKTFNLNQPRHLSWPRTIYHTNKSLIHLVRLSLSREVSNYHENRLKFFLT